MEKKTYEKVAREEIDSLKRRYPKLNLSELAILCIVMSHTILEEENKKRADRKW